jgi:hypothetical protein
MAKKKKKSKKNSGTECAAGNPSMPSERRANAGIEEAENGYVVRVSSEGLGKNKDNHYQSKTFVAMDHPSAMRIASQGFSGLAKKVGKGKKGGKKKASTKKV